MRNVKELIDDGYRSTSNKYRCIAKVASFEDCLKVLETINPVYVKHLKDGVRAQAARTYDTGIVEKLELSIEEFKEFKKNGGGIW